MLPYSQGDNGISLFLNDQSLVFADATQEANFATFTQNFVRSDLSLSGTTEVNFTTVINLMVPEVFAIGLDAGASPTQTGYRQHTPTDYINRYRLEVGSLINFQQGDVDSTFCIPVVIQGCKRLGVV